MKKLLATAAILAFVTAANAAISASLQHWSGPGLLPYSGRPYDSWRLWVHVSGSDDWTRAHLLCTITMPGAPPPLFYQDLSGTNPPNPVFFVFLPDLEYDSYYTSPGDYPNTTYDGDIVRIDHTFDAPTQLHTEWYDEIYTDGGNFVIAQMTILTSDYYAEGLLQYAGSDGTLFDFEFTIPEPGSLALLALGGLALIRRR